MSHQAKRRRPRAALLGYAALGPVAVGLAGAATAVAVAPDVVVRAWAGILPGGRAMPALRADSVDEIVGAAVTGLGVVVLAWYVLSMLAFLSCAVAAGLGRRWRAGEDLLERWGAPFLRRIAVVTLGFMVSAGVGATSAAGATAPAPGLPDDLRWSPVPTEESVPDAGAALERDADLSAPPEPGDPADDRQAAGTRPAQAVAPAAGGGAEASSREAHVVRPGESLWSIAAGHLRRSGVDPTDRAVAVEWPRWYAANVDTVGTDPHLIHPGQELLVPREASHP